MITESRDERRDKKAGSEERGRDGTKGRGKRKRSRS